MTADRADRRRLFELDHTVRNDVPGTDGWRGDAAMFAEELTTSPPFDRAPYLVATDRRTGDYVGLVRIWRNPGGPRFGFVGLLRSHRRTFLGPALVREALLAASTWGSATFVNETSPNDPVVHGRRARVGAERTSRFLQMVRPASGAGVSPTERCGSSIVGGDQSCQAVARAAAAAFRPSSKLRAK